MNCKQGDLAIVVKSFAGNEGRLVRCLQLLPLMRWTRGDGTTYETPSWVIDVDLVGACGDKSAEIADHLLRPIRDPGDDAVDEMVKLVGAPREVAA